jgi:hypothetical protein
LTQGIVLANEPLQKVLQVAAPGPKSLCGEALLHSQEIGEFFLHGLINRRHRLRQAQTFQKAKPVDRVVEDLLLAAILAIRVWLPTGNTAFHCRFNGRGIKRVGRGWQTQKVLDSEQILCQFPQRAELVPLPGAIPQILQAPLQEWAVEMAPHCRTAFKKLIKHSRPLT